MDLDTLHRTLKLAKERKQFERWRYYIPAPKQEQFLIAGASYSERLLLAGNGNGKSETAAFEVSRHMTGEYPPWWKGKRFDKPVRVWVAGTSAKAVTEAAQTKLLGPPGNKELLGTGLIPKETIEGDPRPSRGFPDAVESFQVRHVSGGLSRCVVKTYAQTREDWQGADIDLIWFDEEPPEALYTEGRARLRGRGMTLMTFTPLLGMSSVVCRFREEDDPDRTYIQMGVNDCPWYTDAEKRAQVAGYPITEREARANGEPLLGSGKVFSTPSEDLRIPAIPFDRVPLHWTKLWGIDFGGGSEDAHPFAAVLLAWDREQMPAANGFIKADGPIGTMHVLYEIRMTNSLILQHADAMKRVAANVPVAWPHDGHVKERSSGESMAALYKRQGLKMLDTHATHAGIGGFSTYAGVMDLDAYMQARQFKVTESCPLWFQEYGQYHYDKGVLVKLRDDLMSATRVGHIMRRRAQAVPLGPGASRRPERQPPPVINPWTGREETRI